MNRWGLILHWQTGVTVGGESRYITDESVCITRSTMTDAFVLPIHVWQPACGVPASRDSEPAASQWASPTPLRQSQLVGQPMTPYGTNYNTDGKIWSSRVSYSD